MRPAQGQVVSEVSACDASSEDGVALRAEEGVPDGRNVSKRAICLPLECASAQHILGSKLAQHKVSQDLSSCPDVHKDERVTVQVISGVPI